MFGRAFWGAAYYGPRYWGDGGSGAPVIPPLVAETYSGGWGRVRDESATERKKRIRAERIRLGIIDETKALDDETKRPGDEPTAVEAAGATIAGGAAPLLSPQPSVFDAGALDSGLAFDLAQLHTGAYLDQEIAKHFRILEYLEDEDDAAVLLLALAVLH